VQCIMCVLSFLQIYSCSCFIVAQMLEKKAIECKRWKLQACEAEKKLKLIMSILTPSQLEDLQRQNLVQLCQESSSPESDASCISSLEGCQSVLSEQHLEFVNGHTVKQHQVCEKKTNWLHIFRPIVIVVMLCVCHTVV